MQVFIFCEFDVSKNLILIKSVKLQIKTKELKIKRKNFVTFMHLYIKSKGNTTKMTDKS